MRYVLVILTALIGLVSNAEARHHIAPVKAQQRVIRDVTPHYAKTVQFSAKTHYKGVRYASRGGACDGFHRCRCGTTAARHYGLAYNHNGMNLKMARAWYGFQRTSFHVGAAGVIPHHVLAIVGGSSCSDAVVSDDAGTYHRNVCGYTFVQPGSGGGSYAVASNSGQRTYHARSHHAAPQQYAANSGYNGYQSFSY